MDIAPEVIIAAFSALWAATLALAREVRLSYQRALDDRDKQIAERDATIGLLRGEVSRLVALMEQERAEWQRVLIGFLDKER